MAVHARTSRHYESHSIDKRAWMRAAVLGANDGIVSVAAILMGMLAAGTEAKIVFLAGASALTAGATSMAIGEYVSVSSQKDIENMNIEKETMELKESPELELKELAGIYRKRGLSDELSLEVAQALTKKDALQAHLRDELGIIEHQRANPFQAAYVSSIAFVLGSMLPLLTSWILAGVFDDKDERSLIAFGIVTLMALGLLGWFNTKISGASLHRSLSRSILGGVLALGITFMLGEALSG